MSIIPKAFLNDLFEVAVSAAMPGQSLTDCLPECPKGKTLVIAAGKAAASMAKIVEDNWTGPISGVALTRYDHGLDLKNIEVVEAGHPVPDEAGEQAANDIFQKVSALGPDDLAICLISGGGSALLAKPANGISLSDKKAINKALLASGATISEINTVRKKLSAIKGGRLAVAAYPARVATFMISDVPGDEPSVIASGPTVPDETSIEDALRILEKYNIPLNDTVKRHLKSESAAPPALDHPAFANSRTVMIATPQDSLQAAAKMARATGVEPLILGDSIEGEARDVALVMAGIARQIVAHDEPTRKPCVILSGGETTVTVFGSSDDLGRGGRNAEFLLAFSHAIGDLPGVYALAADTDGIDGTEDNAGAFCDPTTLSRAAEKSMDPSRYLGRHDAYGFFEALGDLIKTGPTRTNVNDFRAILILPTD